MKTYYEIKQALDAGATRADIVDGEVVAAANGFLEFATEPKLNSVLVDHQREVFSVVMPGSDYRGRSYRLKKNDCATLIFEWYKRERNIDGLLDKYLSADSSMIRTAYTTDASVMADMLGFDRIEQYDCTIGDTLVYGPHVGVVVGDGLVLHHIVNKLSCVDKIDWLKVTGIYRLRIQ